MTNPIQWLFRDPDLEKAEEELDEYLTRLEKKVKESGDSSLIEIDVGFPDTFTQQSQDIVEGSVEWRDFYSNRSLSIYSLHCKMERGALLKEHVHPGFDEYIYVISGSIINLMDSMSINRIVVPPEKANNSSDKEGWYKIPAGNSHIIRALEDNTHFVSKFLKPNGQIDI